MRAIPKHPEAHLWPSEIATLGLLPRPQRRGQPCMLSLVDARLPAVVPSLPERTRLFRLFRTHQDWTQVFLAAPTVLGVIDTYGIELIHPMREGRSPHQIGRKASPITAGSSGETLSAAQSVGVDRGVGVCDRQCRG